MTTDSLPAVQPAKSRLLITLVVDTSESMRHNQAIDQLNDALQQWRDVLLRDDYLRRVGEIAIVSFGTDVRVIDPSGRNTTPSVEEAFVPVAQFNPQRLEAHGYSQMVDGVQQALTIIANRRIELRQNGITMAHRPLLYLITDGVPTDRHGAETDQWRDLAAALRQQETGKHLLFFAIGVRGAAERVLRGIAPSAHYYLDDMNFAQVLRLVSASIETVQAATAGSDQPAEELYGEVGDHVRRLEKMRDWLASGSG